MKFSHMANYFRNENLKIFKAQKKCIKYKQKNSKYKNFNHKIKMYVLVPTANESVVRLLRFLVFKITKFSLRK